MKKIIFVFIIITLIACPVLYTMQSQSQETTLMWECTITVTEPNGSMDTAAFGEALNATDGPPADAYDIVKPPPPIMPPYLRVWFDDNLPEPYHQLWKDFRQYPGITKTWNLTVQWIPQDYSSSTSVTIYWDSTIVNMSEYIIMNLCTSNGTILANMRLQHTYTFTCPALTPQKFKIIGHANQPPAQPSLPVPLNGATQVSVTPTLSWQCSDPDDDILTYDVYFGITTPPPRIISNQSSLLCKPGSLQYQTMYYWKIIAWDNKSASTEGPLWVFTTEAKTGSPPGGTNGDDDIENISPIANASRSERRGFVAEHLVFDGSYSDDPDGYISRWAWDFGDGTTGNGEKTTHAYQNIGVYTVTLMVFDNKNASASDTITVEIITANNPPTSPYVNGPTKGSRNTTYSYILSATDIDDDFIQYSIQWGDSTKNTSDFLPNGTFWSVAHRWSNPGRYIITATATDGMSMSEETTLAVFIDVHFVGALGFLYDTTDDDIYDSFYVNASSIVTNVQHLSNGIYLLDTNNDGEWDYRYDANSGSLMLLENQETTQVDQLLFILIIVFAFVVIACLIFFYKKGYL